MRNGFKAHVAQSVEHFLGKEEVAGSIPVMSTTQRGSFRMRPAILGRTLKISRSHSSSTVSEIVSHGKG